jgi:hypothetical protein
LPSPKVKFIGHRIEHEHGDWEAEAVNTPEL